MYFDNFFYIYWWVLTLFLFCSCFPLLSNWLSMHFISAAWSYLHFWSFVYPISCITLYLFFNSAIKTNFISFTFLASMRLCAVEEYNTELQWMLFRHLSHSKIQVHVIGLSLAVSSTYSMALFPVVSLYGVYSFNTEQPATHHPCELNNVWCLKIWFYHHFLFLLKPSLNPLLCSSENYPSVHPAGLQQSSWATKEHMDLFKSG